MCAELIDSTRENEWRMTSQPQFNKSTQHNVHGYKTSQYTCIVWQEKKIYSHHQTGPFQLFHLKYSYIYFMEYENYMVFYSNNMEHFEVLFCWTISSSINLLFRTSRCEYHFLNSDYTQSYIHTAMLASYRSNIIAL